MTPIPEAVVVSNAGPTRYVPLATPVHAAPQVPRQAVYMPYTGEGLARAA